MQGGEEHPDAAAAPRRSRSRGWSRPRRARRPIAFGYDDPVVAAKVLSEFAKTHEALEMKGGLLNGKVIGVEEVKALAGSAVAGGAHRPGAARACSRRSPAW